MTDPILLRAILAMDAYNRGYNAGIKDLGGVGSQIGEATLSTDSTLGFGEGVDSAIGFYAAAYTVAGGSTVVSYRGTDRLLDLLPWSEFGGDIWNGNCCHAAIATS